MQIGTFLPTYWASYGRSTLAEALTATAQVADALGYASLWCRGRLPHLPLRAAMTGLHTHPQSQEPAASAPGILTPDNGSR